MRTAMATALAATMMLGGCATSVPPVEVTRFHLGQPIAPGTVFVEMAGDAVGLEARTFASAVEGELARLGYPAASAEAAGYVVVIDVARDTREALARRSPFSVGIGGGTGGYRSGVGLGVGFNFGGGSRQSVVTSLGVQMKRRLGGDVVWEGRAELEARGRAPASQPGIAAGKLAEALFGDFPGESGRTIRVE